MQTITKERSSHDACNRKLTPLFSTSETPLCNYHTYAKTVHKKCSNKVVNWSDMLTLKHFQEYFIRLFISHRKSCNDKNSLWCRHMLIANSTAPSRSCFKRTSAKRLVWKYFTALLHMLSNEMWFMRKSTKCNCHTSGETKNFTRQQNLQKNLSFYSSDRTPLHN